MIDVAGLNDRLRTDLGISLAPPVKHDKFTRLCLEIEKAVLPLLEAFSTPADQELLSGVAYAAAKAVSARGVKHCLTAKQIASIPFFLKCYSRLGIVVREIAGDHAFGVDRGIAQTALRVLIDQSCRNVASIHETREERLRIFGSQRFKFPVLTASPVVERTMNAALRRAGVGAGYIGLDSRSRQKNDKFRDAAECFIFLINPQLETHYGFSLFELHTWAPAEREELWAVLKPKLRKVALPAFLATEAEDLMPAATEQPTHKKSPIRTWHSVLLPLVSKTVQLPSRRRDRMKEVVLDRMKTALGLSVLKH